ncbi:MAG: fimbria/pilus periplasmic chaperone [Persephonella sp.]|nr:fimbria/pilus periplasmic chaperone [Persephonella sp.]
MRKYIISVFLPLFYFFPVFSLDFTIKPIRIYMTYKKNTAVFEIQSLTDKTIRIETEIKKWGQRKDGSFILEETEDMVVVPPFIKLEPRQKQLVKIAYLGDYDSKLQGSYRLILKQLPEELKFDKKPKKIKTVVQVVLHLSIPIFVNPPDTQLYYNLSFLPEKVSKKEVQIVVRNRGNAFARILNITLYKGGKEIFQKRMALYILPQREIFLSIKPPEDKDKKNTEFKDIPDKIEIVTEDEKEFIFSL